MTMCVCVFLLLFRRHEAKRGNHNGVVRLLETSGKAGTSLVDRDYVGALISGDMEQWGISIKDLRNIHPKGKTGGGSKDGEGEGKGGTGGAKPSTGSEPPGSPVKWRGSFAEVTLAYWRGLKVALKRIPHLEWTQEERSIFKMELSIFSRLAHPHIVQFLGVCTDLQPMALVTEYCRSADLPSLSLSSLLSCSMSEVTFPRRIG